MWLDSHCHLDAPEFAARLPLVVEAAAKNSVSAILVPAVEVADFAIVRDLAHQYAEVIPGLVYTLGIHPLYIGRAQDTDLKVLATAVEKALDDPRFVGIGEIGLDYFVEGLDPKRQAFFFEAQLDLAQQLNLPVIMHGRRSQDAILKALRQRKITGGIAHAFNGSFQQAEQFLDLGFKLGFGGAATYPRALQIRRLVSDLSMSAIVIETDAPDIPPAWLRDEGIHDNEPAFLPRIAKELAQLRNLEPAEFAQAVWQNAAEALPRWAPLLGKINSSQVV
ncbi:MAG: TatD family hydrolase, partial [Burkholderiaceae bacterium]